MAWTAPRTWVTSEFITASVMNTHVRDNLLALDSFLDTTCIPGSTIMPLICDSLGGSDSHRPVVGGVTYSQWHLCNGDADIDGLGFTAPDMRDKFPVGAGSTYAQGATGGATTANNAHTHDAGTLTTKADSGLNDHTHNYSVNTAGPNSTTATDTSGAYDASSNTHQHAINTATGNPTTSPTHVHTATGATASGGSATQSTVPAYRAQYLFLYIGG